MLLFAGCASASQPPITTYDTTEEEYARINQSWISPAEVKVSNYYAGAQAEWNIKIHNGKDVLTSYRISYREPGKLREGYLAAPENAQDWIIISDEALVFAPKETKEILITLSIPKGTVVTDKKWEFWVSVIEQGQGNIETEMCSRWLISMK